MIQKNLKGIQKTKMTNIAILGFGVVGSGIAEVIERNELPIRRMTSDMINVKYILDKRDFPDSPYRDRVIKDLTVIAQDPEISVVCEAMGGVHPAYEFTMACFMAGKSVVTSNKELVATCGAELLNAAKKQGVHYLFEASVGGGIPEIRSMRTSLAMDTVLKIDGIMNGTTNYIMTRMKNDGISFEDALKEAQSLGYAEADPTADVDGIDAQRKIIILSAVATDKLADESEVYTETMTKVSAMDMDAASRWGGTVKLIGSFRNLGDRMSLCVCPRFVKYSDPISHIDDVYNGIKVSLEMTSDVMYYGRGAGSYPTASAMVSDVVSIMTGAVKAELHLRWHKTEPGFVVPFEETSFKYYIRAHADSEHDAIENAKLVIGDVRALAGAPKGCVEFITGDVVEAKMREYISSGALGAVESVIRILD